MKETGIEWIGEIPRDWRIKKLKYNFKFEKGKNAELYTKENIEETDKEKGYPIYSGQTIGDGTLGYTENYEYDIDKCIFITTVGANAMSTRMLKGKFSLSQNCLIMTESKDLDLNLDFTYFALDSLFEYEKGSIPRYMQPSLRISDLKKYSLPTPPLSEQKAIANFLDKKTKSIDNIKETLREQIEVLKNYKKSLIYEATTKGLNKDVKLKETGIEWIGEIPENWEITKNKYLFDRKKDIVGSDWENNQLLSLTKNGIIKKDIEDTSGKQPESFGTYQYVEKSDLILCLFDIDISAVFNGLSDFDGMISPAYKRFNLKEDGDIRYFNYFFDFVFDNRKYKQYSTSLRYTLDNEEFGAIGIIKPPLSEQKAIADYLDKKVSSIDKIIESKQQEIEDIENYKKSLIYEYTTGKKRIENK